MFNYSLLIPMHRSERFINNIRGVIDSHLEHNCGFLLSDQHMLDGALPALRSEYGEGRRFRYFSSSNELNWVENINLLINHCDSEYFRIVPHDDFTTGQQSDELLQCLRQHKSAVVATGPYEIERMDDSGQPKAIRKTQADEFDCDIQNIIHFNRKGYYDGAFKGMIDNKVVKKHGLFIKPTPTLMWSERLWLNALRMTGGFAHSNKLMIVKRYYKESTHAQWNFTRQTYIDGAIIMAAYGEKLIPDHETRELLNKAFMEHALSMATTREA